MTYPPIFSYVPPFVQFLIDFIFLIFVTLQENVEVWLQEHGLEEYWPLFRSNGYAEPSDLVDLKKMSKEKLKETLLIRKPGHLNRLKSLINKLQYPNRGVLTTIE